MKQQLFEYLNKNGYKYEGEDEIISFIIDDLKFYAQFLPKDPYFFRIILPCEDNVQIPEVRNVIAKLNKRYKVAKIIEMDTSPWIVAESFAYSDLNGELLIDRLVRLLEEVFTAYSRERNNVTDNETADENGEESHQ